MRCQPHSPTEGRRRPWLLARPTTGRSRATTATEHKERTQRRAASPRASQRIQLIADTHSTAMHLGRPGCGGAGHPGMGVLVQQPPPARTHRLHLACRGQGKLLPATRMSDHRGGGLTLPSRPLRNPGRFIVVFATRGILGTEVRHQPRQVLDLPRGDLAARHYRKDI